MVIFHSFLYVYQRVTTLQADVVSYSSVMAAVSGAWYLALALQRMLRRRVEVPYGAMVGTGWLVIYPPVN